ncbi:hypothetical protein HYW94_01685 [Candidatus Uhrbacteria bacterium]|nr:hypothetical protein [Candidatus Uhrbacteria bacterium]
MFGKEFFIFNDKIMNTIKINHVTDGGNKEEKEIYELEEKDRYKYHSLGLAIGVSIDYCVTLGLKHKDDFWHRVYGYSVIQNERMEKMMSEAIKKVKLETESYVTVAFYERFSDKKIMFVPKRLEIPNRPELNNFPFNIAFGAVTINDNNVERYVTSVYEPDLSTFTWEGVKKKMKYYNNVDIKRYFWAEIVYDIDRQSYIGTKYCGDTSAGMAFGGNWDMFFSHFTALGITSSIDMLF